MNYPGPSGVDSDQRLVGTDAFREYVMRMTGTTGIKNFINKYKKRPSSNKMSDHLKNLSQVYLEQIAKSAVPVDEADMSGAPSIKDAKPEKKTKVKYDPHMKVMALRWRRRS